MYEREKFEQFSLVVTLIITFDLDLIVNVGHHYGRPLPQVLDSSWMSCLLLCFCTSDVTLFHIEVKVIGHNSNFG